MNERTSIKNCCFVNSSESKTRFVGVKVSEEGPEIYFPLGFRLSETEEGVRSDILLLIKILQRNSSNEQGEILLDQNNKNISSIFPMDAYQEIIVQFLNSNGKYFCESQKSYTINGSGKINWNKTIKTQKAYLQKDGTVVYPKMVTRLSFDNYNEIITRIHKYCVYESFRIIGWLYTPFQPENPNVVINEKQFLTVLQDRILLTNNDKEKKLLLAMKKIINYQRGSSVHEQSTFGTEKFEYIWEKMIDEMFGVINKQEYFPRARWNLIYGNNRTQYPLEPDTIMIMDDECYVIDAKYYKYGVTGNNNDLPDSSSINKQITYGQYIFSKKSQFNKVYNAFILPFNKEKNFFGVQQKFLNIGESLGEWRENTEDYERVQGVVLDTRYLMQNYLKASDDDKIELIKAIQM